MLVVATVVVAAGSGGCSPDRSGPVALDAEEIRLVNEVLELMNLRVQRARDPEGAQTRREALGPLYTDEELEQLIDRVAQDPARAAALVQAIRDSLEARRRAWFPPETIDDQPGGETGSTPSPDGARPITERTR